MILNDKPFYGGKFTQTKNILLTPELQYILEKLKNTFLNLTNIHNELDGLQGGQEGEYYHLTESQYNCVMDNCNETCTIGKWTIQQPT